MNRLTLLLLGLLTGCTVWPPAADEPPSIPSLYAETMVTDSLKLLMKTYPPAHTHFTVLIHNDDFGHAFIQQLRAQGYGVQEYGVSPQVSEAPHATIDVRYTLSGHNAEDYWLKLTLNTTTFSRLYHRHNGTLQPRSCWSGVH